MATNYNHAEIGIVDSLGNVNVIYPKNTGEDVSVTANSNLPTATTVQGVVTGLKSAAFKSVTDIVKDAETVSTTETWSGRVISEKMSEVPVLADTIESTTDPKIDAERFSGHSIDDFVLLYMTLYY